MIQPTIIFRIGYLLVLLLSSQLGTAQRLPVWAKTLAPVKFSTLDQDGNLYVAGEFRGSLTLATSSVASTGGTDVFVAKFSADSTLLWLTSGGGGGADDIASLQVDAQQNVYVTGTFGVLGFRWAGGTTTLASQGRQDVYVAKLSSAGQPSWLSSGGAASSDSATTLRVDSQGSVHVGGTFSTNDNSPSFQWGSSTVSGINDVDVFVVKLDAQGNVAWLRGGGGEGNDNLADLTLGSTNHVYVTGRFNGPTFELDAFFLSNSDATTSDFTSDVYVARLDPTDGSTLWLQSGGGPGYDEAVALALASNRVYVAGHFGVSFRWRTDVTRILENDNPSESAEAKDVFVAQLNSADGSTNWLQRGGGNDEDHVSFLQLDNAGEAYLFGWYESDGFGWGGSTSQSRSEGSRDVFVSKLQSSNGSVAWSRGWGGAAQDDPGALRIDGDGSVYLGGHSKSPVFFWADQETANPSEGSSFVFVSQLTADGSPVWQQGGGGSGDDFLSTLQVDNTGGVYVAGSSRSNDFNWIGSPLTYDTSPGYVFRLADTPVPTVPVLESLSVDSGVVDETIILTTSGVNADQPAQVLFGETPVEATVAGNQLQVVIPDVRPGRYDLRVSQNEQTSSNSLPFTILPPVITGLAAIDSTESSVRISWNASLFIGNYLLSVARDPDFTDPLYLDRDIGNLTAFTIEDLEPGTTYYVRLRVTVADVDGIVSEPTPVLRINTLLSAPVLAEVTSPVQVGNTVTVRGQNFGTDRGQVSVQLGEQTIASDQLVTFEPDQLSFRAPALTPGAYRLTVRVGDNTSNSLPLTIEAGEAPPTPLLFAFDEEVEVGSTISPTGVNLGDDPSVVSAQVVETSTPVEVLGVSDNTLSLRIPEGLEAGVPYRVEVTISGEVVEGSVRFLIPLPPPQPTVTGIAEENATAGGFITVLGANLGNNATAIAVQLTQDENTIADGATPVSINSAGSELTVRLSDALTAGTYQLSVAVAETPAEGTVSFEIATDPQGPVPGPTPFQVVSTNFADQTHYAPSEALALSVQTRNGAGVTGTFSYQGLTPGANDTPGDPVEVSDNTFTASLAADELSDSLGVRYRFVFSDSLDRALDTITGAVYRQYPDDAFSSSSPVFGPWREIDDRPSEDLSIADFNIIAFPFEAQPVAEVLEELGEPDDAQWRLFRHEAGSDTSFPEYGESNRFAFEPGQGYFLIMRNDQDATFGGPVARMSEQDPQGNLVHQFALQPGWNLIGNPFPFAIDWNEVVAHPLNEAIQDTLWQLERLGTNDDDFTPSGTLSAFEGAFLFWTGDSEASLYLPPQAKLGANEGSRTADQPADKGWEVPITLEQGAYRSSRAGIGMRPTAIDDLDRYDALSVPKPQLQAELLIRDLPVATNRSVVAEQPDYLWSAGVVGPVGQEVTLRWEPERVGRLAEGLYLWDDTRGHLVTMAEQATYSVTVPESGAVPLQIYYGRPEVLWTRLAIPHLEIGALYPNPATHQVKLPINVPMDTLSRQLVVTLNDSRGQRVGRYTFEDLPGGYHELDIPLKAGLSRGLYYCRIQVLGAENLTFSKTILKN